MAHDRQVPYRVGRRLIVAALIATIGSGCSATPSDHWGPSELVDELVSNGVSARLEASPYAASPFLAGAISEQVLCIDGDESIVYEYSAEDLQVEDSARILPNGGFAIGHFDLRRGRVMWWAKGRVIVNYNSADARLWESLSAVLGDTLSPDSETTGDLSVPPEPSEICS